MRLNPAAVLVAGLLLAGVAAACTVAAFGPAATVDGRPILWKNRDVDNDNQEAAFRIGPRYRYVTNVYGSEDTLSAWGGVNEVGFAIMNSNSYNLSGFVDSDDGSIMAVALGTCATVDDFKRVMDSTNFVGRTQPANFGVFDSTGRTVFFEASNTFYSVHDAGDDSLGYLIRANYSVTGDTLRMRGRNRFERASELCRRAHAEGRLGVPFIVGELARDIGQVGFDPYPLPWQQTWPGLPPGYLPIDTTICRTSTRSVEIMVGPRPGEPVGRGMMWIMLGSPDAALPIPLWVSGGQVPEQLNGPERSEICDEANSVRNFLRSDRGRPGAVNTFRLSLVREELLAYDSLLLAMVRDSEALWPDGPTPAQASSLTAAATRLVLDAYVNLWDRIGRRVWGTSLPARETAAVTPRNLGRDSLTAMMLNPDYSGPAAVYDASGREMASLLLQRGRFSCARPALAAGTYYVVYPPAAGIEPGRFTIIR